MTYADQKASTPSSREDASPLISIVLPIYNVESYLPQCLDSLLVQTYRNLEIILVDDESPDRCGAICDEYAQKDSRIKVFHIPNSGVSAARNYGIDQTHGEWIGFTDPDDWTEPNMFETLLKTAQSEKADVVMCGYVLDYTTGPETVRQWEKKVMTGTHEIARAYFHEEYFKDYLWCKLFKSSFFDGGVRSPKGRTYEDAYFTDQLILKAHRVVGIPDCLYHYRRRKTSIVSFRTLKKELDFWQSKKERFDTLADVVPECRRQMMTMCADAVRRTWKIFANYSLEPEMKHFPGEISAFARKHFVEVLFGKYKPTLKFCMFMAMFNNRLSYRIVDKANKKWMKVLNKTEFHYEKMFD